MENSCYNGSLSMTIRWSLLISFALLMGVISYQDRLYYKHMYSYMYTNTAEYSHIENSIDGDTHLQCPHQLSMVFVDRMSVMNASVPPLIVPPVKTLHHPMEDAIYTTTPLLLSLHTDPIFIYNQANHSDVHIGDLTDSVYRFCSHSSSREFVATDALEETVRVASISTISIHILMSQPVHTVEEYRLDINPPLVNITTYSYKGVLNSFSTLGQLLHSPVPIRLPVSIFDWPDRPWRGLMIDVARHFLPLSHIRRALDAMEAAKATTLHLHLTDSQSFPLLLEDTETIALSNLAKLGSFAAKETTSSNRKVYTLKDLRDIVEYARLRGIEVIPEIDVPSHTLSWGNAFPDIVVNCPKFANTQQSPVNVHALDPSNSDTLAVVKAVLTQVSEIFPSKYFHVGGDEVLLQCWMEDSDLAEWVAAKGITYIELLRAFETSIFEHVYSLNKIPMSWQGLLDEQVLPDATAPLYPPNNRSNGTSYTMSIVEPWKCWSGLAGRAASNAMKNGHDVVTSACWYLDFDSEWEEYLNADPVGTALAAGNTQSRSLRAATEQFHNISLEYLHSVDGVAYIDNGKVGVDCETLESDSEADKESTLRRSLSETKGRVVGGEAAIWTEKIDYTNFECRLWPRTAAMATAMWGYKNTSRPQYPQNETMKGRDMMMSYVRFRHYLEVFGIIPSEISFLEPSNPARGSYYISYSPKYFESEKATLEYITAQEITLSDNGLQSVVKISSQCPGINPVIQRSLDTSLIQIYQLNAADGASGSRASLLNDWLIEKANSGVSIIGFCELNNWHIVENSRDRHHSFPVMRSRAADGGYAFSHIMHNTQPYNLGIMTSVPFRILGEYGPPTFQRGLLHVYIPTLQLHVFVAHLHAHSSVLREKETLFIAGLVHPLVKRREKVLVMGDLNSLFRDDKPFHDRDNLVGLFNRTDNPTLVRLKKKFCVENGTEINYQPLQNLVDVGLMDSCIAYCDVFSVDRHGNSERVEGKQFTYDECISKRCAATEPTEYNPEWSNIKGHEVMPMMRLDFIFVSEAVLVDRSGTRNINSGNTKLVTAGVEVTNITQMLSDHFPVYISWKES